MANKDTNLEDFIKKLNIDPQDQSKSWKTLQEKLQMFARK